MYKRLIASAVVFGMAAGAPPAQAQTACAARDAVIEQLQGRFHELQLATGMQDSGAVLEVWASPATGTWTVLLTSPQGVSCVTASGTAWSLGIAPEPAPGVTG